MWMGCSNLRYFRRDRRFCRCSSRPWSVVRGSDMLSCRTESEGSRCFAMPSRERMS